MQIDIESITSGSMDNERVYICDFRQPDIQKKPIRSVPPTLVQVRPNTMEILGTKHVYYSNSHFAPIGTNGKPLKKVIGPYDNTGFRSYTGVPLNVFTTEEECNECWNRQLDEVKQRFENYRAKVHEELDKAIDDLQGKKV